MRQHHRGQTGRSEEEKSGVPAEHSRICELDQRTHESREQRRVGMGEGVLIEMVDMGDAKVEWGQKDQTRRREVGQQVQGNKEGAEEDLFGDGALEGSTLP